MFLLLLSICDIIFAPRLLRRQIQLLTTLIADHHRAFLTEYTANLLPKHHFMTHYPKTIELMGPLRNLWVMRFEGKHNLFKQISCKMQNFKNLPKLLAERHQQLMYNNWTSADVLQLSLETSPPVETNLKNYVYIETLLQGIDPPWDVPIFRFKWVKYGFYYQNGFFVCTSTINSIPVFEKIVDIFSLEGNVMFVTKVYNSVAFNEHVHSYTVECISDDLKLLYYKEPYETSQAHGSSQIFIVPKYTLS